MDLVKEDFYCGAFLSYLLNNKIVPALFEDNYDKSRKIYDFTTDKCDYRTYVKSSDKPSSVSRNNTCNIWTFHFTEKQVDEIKRLKEETKNKNLLFVFVCGQPKLSQSKVAVIPAYIVYKCIDVDRKHKYKTQKIKIRLVKGHWDFDVYGTAREDKKGELDNTLKVRTNNIDDLFMRSK